MRIFKILLLVMVTSTGTFAKSYKFKIDNPIDVTMVRSASPGKKMVQVVAYSGSADRAVDQAMVDAVVACSFYGLSNSQTMESIPSVLKDGKSQYLSNKKFFDKFFKKGQFLPFVSKVTDYYPAGTNNVKTKKGRKITILLVVDWQGLERLYRDKGLETQLSIFDNL